MAGGQPLPEHRPRGQTITVAQAAALLGRSERRLQGLVNAGYIDRATHDKYPLVGVIRGCWNGLQDQPTYSLRISTHRTIRFRPIAPTFRVGGIRFVGPRLQALVGLARINAQRGPLEFDKQCCAMRRSDHSRSALHD